MYPNPATDRVFIETGEVTGSEIYVSIFDITGKLKQQVLKPSENKIEVDIHNLSNGIYFVELKSNNKKSLQKLVKH
jgi:hypothetical protein